MLRKSGYSDKAIGYFINRVNVGEIEKPVFSMPIADPAAIQCRFKGKG